MISGNFEEFDRQLVALQEEWLPQLYNRVMRALVLKAFGTIVIMTPRDTGRAQNSWDVSVNTPSEWLPPEGAESYAAADVSKAIGALRSLRFGDVVYITSNLVYIQRLNEGWSAQAPAHFVESALEAAVAELANAA